MKGHSILYGQMIVKYWNSFLLRTIGQTWHICQISKAFPLWMWEHFQKNKCYTCIIITLLKFIRCELLVLMCFVFTSQSRIFHSFRDVTIAILQNLDLRSAPMVIEQWWFSSMSHLLWHGASVYNGHLRGLVILTAYAERLAFRLSLPVLKT